MNDDADQLRRYAATGAEDAFAAVVQRNLGLVYHAALRRVGGDAHRAQDVTQLVFTALARNARPLASHPDLTGWLFTTTRFLAAKVVRSERRRVAREHAAELLPSAMSSPSDSDTGALHVVLDDVMMELRQLDRQVLLLRFHRGLRLAEIGAHLGATENAVQKRLERVLEQLKDKLAQRGITSTAAALALAFEQQASLAVPAGLAATATTAAIAGGAGSVLAGATFMTITKVQFGFAAAAALAVSVGLVWEMRENAGLRAAVAQGGAATETRLGTLRQQLAGLTQRAAAAEADAAQLQKALSAARAVPAAGGRARVLSDAQEEARAAMQRAGQLAAEGKQTEALELYLQLYRGLEGTHGFPDRQVVILELKRLGQKFPPATLALRQLRETAMQQLRDHSSSRDVVGEIAHINEALGDGPASLALYDSLPAGDARRQAVGLISHRAFLEAHRYADAMVGKSFGQMLSELEMGTRSAADLTGLSRTHHAEFVVTQALDSIEALAGVNDRANLRTLMDKLFAYDGSEATRAAVKQRLERAGFQGAP